VSIAEILKQRGITYINTPFGSMFNAEAVSHDVFGLDAGVMTIDRGEDLFDWNIIGPLPIGELPGPTCGMHWPNLLHADPARNSEIVAGWVAFLAPYAERADTLLAPDPTAFQHQLVHQVCTRINIAGEQIELDFEQVDRLPGRIGKNELTLKVESPSALHFKSDNITVASESWQRRDGLVLHTLLLQRKPEVRSAHLSYAPASS
jgi:hypothetical protein